MAEPKKKAGRPQGAPSQVLPVRIPVDLVQRLNRYLDLAETHTGLRSNPYGQNMQTRGFTGD